MTDLILTTKEEKIKADTKHKAKIHGEITAAVLEWGDFSTEEAGLFLDIILSEKIPHITINY